MYPPILVSIRVITAYDKRASDLLSGHIDAEDDVDHGLDVGGTASSTSWSTSAAARVVGRRPFVVRMLQDI